MTVRVRFEIRAIEDKHAKKEKGYAATQDVEFAVFRQPGDKHTEIDKIITPEEIEYWKNSGHLQHVHPAYQAWKAGLEEPVNGLSLRDWPIISPAQLQHAMAVGIRTVEDFATLSEDGLRAFGLGGQVLKQKAKTYLESANNHGKVVEEMSALREQVEQMKAMLADKPQPAKNAKAPPPKKPAIKPTAGEAA